MQLECARYVNLRFAPHPATGPSSPLPPSLIPSPSANGSNNGSADGSTGTAQLSSSLIDPTPSLTREESRFDAEEIWPLLGAEENPSPSTSTSPRTHPNTLHKPAIVDGVALVELYASLKQGQSVKQWYATHSRSLANIDIRRFITFGVIKGFLYRVHKYAFATGQPAPPPRASSFTPTALSSRVNTGTNTPYAISNVSEDASISTVARRESSRERAGSVVSGSRNANGSAGAPSTFWEEDDEIVGDEVLGKYLDGTHCFDQICTELEMSERELTARLKRYPWEVLILHR